MRLKSLERAAARIDRVLAKARIGGELCFANRSRGLTDCLTMASVALRMASAQPNTRMAVKVAKPRQHGL